MSMLNSNKVMQSFSLSKATTWSIESKLVDMSMFNPIKFMQYFSLNMVTNGSVQSRVNYGSAVVPEDSATS